MKDLETVIEEAKKICYDDGYEAAFNFLLGFVIGLTKN